VEAGEVIDRTLRTDDAELNARMWIAAGYAQPPTLATMVDELARIEIPT
jgi:hypothetical protein